MIEAWAQQWGIPPAAIEDLYRRLRSASPPPAPMRGTSEAAMQVEVRLEAAQKGVDLYRNNVGALLDQRGVPVRYGLANETKAENQAVKSADLIGWRRVVITPEMVGRPIAQFVSREVKHHGWRWSGDAHELAQSRWLLLVAIAGGDAAFASGRGTL